MNKKVLAVLGLAVILPVLGGCNQKPGPVDDGKIHITDVKGRQMTFEQHAEKVLCFGAGALRLYSYVGDMDKLIGVENYEKSTDAGLAKRPYQYVFQDKIKALPVVGKGGPGIPYYPKELIVQMQPDVIFTCDKAEASQLDALSQQIGGIPVVDIDYGPLNVFDLREENNPFRTSLKTIALVMGTEAKYNDLTTYIDQTVTGLDNKTKDVADDQKEEVYLGGVGKQKAKGLNCSQRNHPMLNAIHAKNILDTVIGDIYPNEQAGKKFQVNEEVLTRLNPKKVFIDQGGLNESIDSAKSTTYTNWEAIRNGQTYVILPQSDYNVQSECALLNAMYVASVLNPTIYKNFDAVAAGNDVFTHFYGANTFDAYLTDNNLKGVIFTSTTLVK